MLHRIDILVLRGIHILMLLRVDIVVPQCHRSIEVDYAIGCRNLPKQVLHRIDILVLRGIHILMLRRIDIVVPQCHRSIEVDYAIGCRNLPKHCLLYTSASPRDS